VFPALLFCSIVCKKIYLLVTSGSSPENAISIKGKIIAKKKTNRVLFRKSFGQPTNQHADARIDAKAGVHP